MLFVASSLAATTGRAADIIEIRFLGVAGDPLAQGVQVLEADSTRGLETATTIGSRIATAPTFPSPHSE